jgi:signal transduction histidine kinase
MPTRNSRPFGIGHPALDAVIIDSHGARMKGDGGTTDLRRLQWIGLIAPVAFVCGFELLRAFALDQFFPRDTAHVVSALLMAVGVVVFAAAMSFLFDRTQRRIVRQNRDLTVMHAITSEVHAGDSLPDTLAGALARMLEQTDALAGLIRVDGPDLPAMTVRNPAVLPPGLDWVTALLDEPPGAHLAGPRYGERRAVDAALLDVPLLRGSDHVGLMRLAFHPAGQPNLSDEALTDIGGVIATAIAMSSAATDLARREREAAALYEVSLALTGHTDLREVLNSITHHARELLGAERAVVCLADHYTTPTGKMARIDRRALAGDGSTCVVPHAMAPGSHGENPDCRMQMQDREVAFMAHPLRGPDVVFGELCVARSIGGPFDDHAQHLLGALADLAAVAVRTAQLHESEQQWTIVSERDRIARELHDSVAQVLGVVHLRLRAITARPDAPQNGVATELDDLADLADEAYRDVREAILGLRESVSVDKGFETTLRDYLQKYSRHTGIGSRLIVDDGVAGTLSPRIEVQLLRVVQEALTNVRKHAGASMVVVRLSGDRNCVSMSVDDDGVGFDPSRLGTSFTGGFGMSSMQERVQAIGGDFEVQTSPGKGTRITVRLGPEEARVTPSAASTHSAGR